MLDFLKNILLTTHNTKYLQSHSNAITRKILLLSYILDIALLNTKQNNNNTHSVLTQTIRNKIQKISR